MRTSEDLDAGARQQLLELWSRAYGDRFSDDDADHAYGGIHVLAVMSDRVIGHASAIPRRVKFDGDEWRVIGYVEAVAVDPEIQGRGVGSEIMRVLQFEMLKRWPLAMLSTGRATTFYQRLGWEQWLGISYTQTSAGRVPDGEHGGLLILRGDPVGDVRLDVDVTCEDRLGDAW